MHQINKDWLLDVLCYLIETLVMKKGREMILIQFACLKMFALIEYEILLESLTNMPWVPWFITNKIHMIHTQMVS